MAFSTHARRSKSASILSACRAFAVGLSLVLTLPCLLFFIPREARFCISARSVTPIRLVSASPKCVNKSGTSSCTTSMLWLVSSHPQLTTTLRNADKHAIQQHRFHILVKRSQRVFHPLAHFIAQFNQGLRRSQPHRKSCNRTFQSNYVFRVT